MAGGRRGRPFDGPFDGDEIVNQPEPALVAAQAAAARKSVLSGNAMGVASMLMWSAGFPAADILLDTWPPLALITARFVLALALLIPLWIAIDGWRIVRHAHWARGSVVGAIGFGLGAYLLLQAQALTDPVSVALIASASPIAGTLIEMLHRTRRLTWRFGAGLAASVAGGAVATSALAPADLGPGAACAVASVFLFVWGSMAAVRDFPGLSPVGRSTVTLAGGMVAVSVIFLGSRAAGLDVLPRATVTQDQVGLLLVYAIAGMALSQVMWIASVGRLGVAVAAFHINVAPFYVMLLMVALGASWNWPQAAGAAIVALGVMLSQRRGA